MNTEDTIIGIATATGRASVNILRLSGKEAIPCYSKIIFFLSWQALQKISIPQSLLWLDNSSKAQKIDEVLLLVMKAPKSYTTEDVVEVHFHGGHFSAKCFIGYFYKTRLATSTSGRIYQKSFSQW